MCASRIGTYRKPENITRSIKSSPDLSRACKLRSHTFRRKGSRFQYTSEKEMQCEYLGGEVPGRRLEGTGVCVCPFLDFKKVFGGRASFGLNPFRKMGRLRDRYWPVGTDKNGNDNKIGPWETRLLGRSFFRPAPENIEMTRPGRSLWPIRSGAKTAELARTGRNVLKPNTIRKFDGRVVDDLGGLSRDKPVVGGFTLFFFF